MNDLVAWLLSIAAFAAIVVCTAVAARSFAGDAANGRRRCPRCWHELGPTGTRCAECGHDAPDEPSVMRTRRRPWRGALAVLAILGIGVAARFRFLDSGPWSVAPTQLLLAVVPRIDGAGYRSAAWELAQRAQAGLLDDAQTVESLRMAIRGDADAPPPGPAWQRKYEPILRAALRRTPRESPAILELLDIPPVLRVQSVPGDGTEPLLSIELDEWWPDVVECEAELLLPDGTTRRAEFRPGGRAPSLLVPVGSGDGGSIEVRIGARIVGSGGEYLPTATVRTRLDPVDLERCSRASASLVPADGDEFRAALADVFAEGLLVWRDGTPRAGMRFAVGATGGEEFDGVAFGVVVELLEDGVVRRTSRLWWRGGSGATASSWLPSVEDPDAMQRLFEAEAQTPSADPADGTPRGPRMQPGWSLRVRGERHLASYALRPSQVGSDAPAQPTRFFAGSIELPLPVTRTMSSSPPRRWTRDATAGSSRR